jgi:hypothetical protein
MSDANAIGMNTGYPQADIRTGAYATPYQQPISRDVVAGPQFAGGGSINLQGTFSSGGGQGGGQTGGSNNPQPFIGNNNAPSMMPAVMPQQGFTPMPSPDGFGGMPGGLQALLKGPMSQGMAFAGGGSVDTNAPQKGLFKNLLPPGAMQDGISNAEVGGYTYDPVTQMYVKKGGEGATMVSPTGGISGASGSSGSGIPSGPPPTTTPEEFAAQSERNQKVNDFLTNISAVLSPGATLARSLLDTPLAGGIANAFGGTQAPAPVSDMGTYAVDSGSDGIGGEGIGGGDISGQSEGTPAIARGGLLAKGGISNLGDYSDGGRLLRGPGDGISDSIPAMIGKKQPARLADGEFVVPARIVSELGNGSTEAGARKLYAMMDRVQKSRGKTVGKGKVATNSRAAKHLPA